MQISSRVQGTTESVTLKVNHQVNKMALTGKLIYNMTSGQLPFKPTPEFINELRSQLNFLKSYQYSPISGFGDLRKKIINYTSAKRDVNLTNDNLSFDCIINNGTKHTIYNVLGALINPGDEVIILTPYWVSYPEMIKFWGGVPKVVKSLAFDDYTPHIEDIKKAIGPKTKALILNSPNNPAGIHYSEGWMKDFSKLLENFPDLIVLSDEVYSDLYYFDPKPTYFYQYNPQLLNQTVIINGISKSFACTGLRIGWCIGDSSLIEAMSKIQSQTTSGPNSLVQRALYEFDFESLENFFDPVKVQLRECAQIVREEFRKAGLSHCWYQTTSGFYFLLDFSRTPVFEKVYKDSISGKEDYADQICEDLLSKTGVALVPGSSFGYINSARLSMTLEIAPFKEGILKLMSFLVG